MLSRDVLYFVHFRFKDVVDPVSWFCCTAVFGPNGPVTALFVQLTQKEMIKNSWSQCNSNLFILHQHFMFLSPVLPTRMFKKKKHPTLLLTVFPPQLPAECDALAAAQAGALEETFFLYREAQRCIGLHSFTLPLSLSPRRCSGLKA